jgi:hypothetical protein
MKYEQLTITDCKELLYQSRKFLSFVRTSKKCREIVGILLIVDPGLEDISREPHILLFRTTSPVLAV